MGSFSQIIYKGEESGISLWGDALNEHDDWIVYASKQLADELPKNLGERKKIDDTLFLPTSLRADFIDCSKWVEQAINRTNSAPLQAQKELEDLQKTSMRILVTRDLETINQRMSAINSDHPDWQYGMLISNFAEQQVIRQALPGWDIGFNGRNTISSRHYGEWFSGGCKKLSAACSVYGCQGLELDCPIVIWGGDYIRKDGKWEPSGNKYERENSKNHYKDAATIVENNYRVLLTRARKEMILLIPKHYTLNETYEYFINMGIDILENERKNEVKI